MTTSTPISTSSWSKTEFKEFPNHSSVSQPPPNPDHFESKISPDSHISAKELDNYLTPFKLNRNVQVDTGFLDSKNPYFDLFLEILQVEVELYNKLEQQKSILNLRTKKMQIPQDKIYEQIFKEVSYRDTGEDERFANLDLFNMKVREPCNYSMLDFEEFHLFSLACNKFYDNDGEISQNEFTSFCLGSRKQTELVYKRIADNLYNLDPNEDKADMMTILQECQLEYGNKINSFLDGGVTGDRAYKGLAEGKPNHTDLVQIIRNGEADEQGLNYDRYQPSVPANGKTKIALYF